MKSTATRWVIWIALTACAEQPPASAPESESTRPNDAERDSEQSPDDAPTNGTLSDETRASSESPDQRQDREQSGHFEDLEVPGHPTALLWVPNSTREQLPLFAVAHGAGGGPDWHCEYWSAVVESGAFLLCLRGHPINKEMGSHFFPEHHTLGRLFGASVSAVDARFGKRVSADHGVYIGYSQGATMGSLMLADHAARFSHALFLEGGFKTWNVARAQKFKRAGGEAVFIACGTNTCDGNAKNSVRWMERAGLRARFFTAEGAGHTPAGDVGLAAIEGLAWLLAPENAESKE